MAQAQIYIAQQDDKPSSEETDQFDYYLESHRLSHEKLIYDSNSVNLWRLISPPIQSFFHKEIKSSRKSSGGFKIEYYFYSHMNL